MLGAGKDLELIGRFSEFSSPDYGPEPVRHASIPMLLLISMPRMPIQMAWAAQWAALGPYLGTMLPPFAVQLTQLIGPLTGITLAPVVGVLSDRCTSRFGRRRPFILAGALASVLSWLVMGFTKQFAEKLGDYGTGEQGTPSRRTWTAVLTILTYTWMDITVNIVQTPALLIVADFAGDRQTTGAALGQAWATVGSILVSVYILVFGPAHKSLGWFLCMLGGIMFVVVLLVCLFAKEEPLEAYELDEESSVALIGRAFRSTWYGIKTLPHMLIIYAVIFACVMYGFTGYNGSKGQFFGVVVFGGDPHGADTCGEECPRPQQLYNEGVQMASGEADLFFYIFGYVYLWILPFLVSKIGAKWLLAISLVPQSLLMVMAFSEVKALNVAIVVVTNMTQSTVFALLVPIVINTFGYRNEVGIYVGALNSANCVGQLLSFFTGALFVGTSLGFKLPVFFGGVMSFVALLLTVFWLKLKMYSL